MNYLNVALHAKLKNVLLATDFSQASMAADWYAAAIARHYDGKVYVVHVIRPQVYSFAPPEAIVKIEEGVRLWAHQEMNALLKSEQLRDVPHEGVVRYGEPWDILGGVVSQNKIDLIVTGTRGKRGVQKLIMGSVAEEILRLSPVPVLTVRPDARRSDPGTLRTILYATDFSVDSIRAMAYAFSLAQEFQACLVVLHVAPVSGEDPEVRNRLETFFTGQLQQMVPADILAGCQPRMLVEFGDPTAGILRSADAQRVDLIVMGVRGAGSMVRAATHFGSTAYRVISEACAPVLSVRQLH